MTTNDTSTFLYLTKPLQVSDTETADHCLLQIGRDYLWRRGVENHAHCVNFYATERQKAIYHAKKHGADITAITYSYSPYQEVSREKVWDGSAIRQRWAVAR